MSKPMPMLTYPRPSSHKLTGLCNCRVYRTQFPLFRQLEPQGNTETTEFISCFCRGGFATQNGRKISWRLFTFTAQPRVTKPLYLQGPLNCDYTPHNKLNPEPLNPICLVGFLRSQPWDQLHKPEHARMGVVQAQRILSIYMV